MKTTREKFLTVAEAEKATGVHYTVNHSGKMEGMQSLSTSCLCNKYCKNRSIEYSNAIVHAFQRFRAPFSGKIVHIFPEQNAAFN